MNIVHIFCDELRQDALGCYGSSVVPMRTPNIDSIAESGTLFENCFCNSPVCVPSRASMLTGLYPEDTGVYHNEAADPAFQMPFVPDTFPQVLSRNGCRTANFGKTHLPRQLRPFELDDQTGGDMRLGLSPEEFDGIEKLSPLGRKSMCLAGLYPELPYGPEKVTDNAIDWMSRQSEPFYVRISYLQPHTPVILKRGYETIYESCPFSGELEDISGLSRFEQVFAGILRWDELTDEQRIKAKVYYYGLVSWVDDQVGRILDFLREDMDNTIIIFNSDHGALRGESRGASKQIFNRACQAIPLIIRDPRRPGGVRDKRLCSNIDLARTIFGLAGIDPPEQFKGTDLFGGGDPGCVYSTIGFGEPDSFAMPNARLGKFEDGGGWPRRACIREGQYRLDMTVRQDGELVGADREDVFFVDTSHCPEENKNMYSDPEYRDTAAKMREKLLTHCRRAVENNT